MERTLKERKKQNPHKYFVPNGKVEQFIKMVGSGDVFVSLLSAANGEGKTAGGANILAHILWGQSGNKWFEEERFDWEYEKEGFCQSGTRKATDLPLFKDFPFPRQGRIVSDPTTVKEIIVPELKKWFPKGRYDNKKSGKNYKYNWWTDTGFKFELMTYEQDVSEFESATLGWAWFDEPPPLAIFKATVARMRRGGIIFITATPLMGSAWMYDHIMTYKGDKQGQRDFVQADIEDNCIEHGIRGILKHKDIERMVAEYDEEDKQARIHGKFHHLVGIVFKKFNRKVHIIKPFEITKKDYVVFEALDPHPRNPDAVMWLAVDKKGTKFIVDELYGVFTTGELANRINKKADRYRIEMRLADPSAFVEDKHQDNPGEQTLAAKLWDLGLEYQKATKDRTRADRRIKDALDYEERGEEIIVAPELYVFDTCKRTIWELEHLVWDEWRGTAAERKSPKEKPVDKDDHEIEDLGRILVQEPVFFPMPRMERRSISIKTKENLDPFA